MASGSSWSRFPPITLCAATRDRAQRHADVTCTNLENLTLTVRKISRFRPGDTTADQPDVWTLLDFEADEAEADELAPAFASVLDEPGWYVNFQSPRPASSYSWARPWASWRAPRRTRPATPMRTARGLHGGPRPATPNWPASTGRGLHSGPARSRLTPSTQRSRRYSVQHRDPRPSRPCSPRFVSSARGCHPRLSDSTSFALPNLAY